MSNSPESSASAGTARTDAVRRYASWVSAAALAAWAWWWWISLEELNLWGCAATWIRHPFFGADFTTQSDYAARVWVGGADPYLFRDHLFHYPPIVIRLFLWTPFFPNSTALRIWVVVLAALIVLGTLAAVRMRRQLGLERLPALVALALVLFSFPAIFTLERSNFDLITLAVLLVTLPLFRRSSPRAEFIAGCILAIGPWVKLYPGIMGLGLIATRRWRALAGFGLAGLAIGLAAPAETLRSFEALRLAVERIKQAAKVDPLPTWSHSLSIAWQNLGQALADTPLAEPLQAISGDAAGMILVLLAGGWVSWRIYRARGAEGVLYPLLLWLNALGSCVGAIANDYSLMFLPLTVVAVFSIRDPWFVRIAMALLIVWWQPIELPIGAVPLFIIKMMGLVATGVCLVRRAEELAERAARPAESPSGNDERSQSAETQGDGVAPAPLRA